MLIGDPDIFAIESFVNKVYPNSSFLALGFFSIHVAGNVYGVRLPDASMLSCSFNAVRRRIERRGCHLLPCNSDLDALLIVEAVHNLIYSENPKSYVLGLPRENLIESLYGKEVLWAPDGDEAFDDGGHVLHIDYGDKVRIIAFLNNEKIESIKESVAEICLSSNEFYEILGRWRNFFEKELCEKIVNYRKSFM